MKKWKDKEKINKMMGMKMMNNGHDGQSLLTWTKQATTERSWRNSDSDNSDSDKGIGDDNERTRQIDDNGNHL